MEKENIQSISFLREEFARVDRDILLLEKNCRSFSSFNEEKTNPRFLSCKGNDDHDLQRQRIEELREKIEIVDQLLVDISTMQLLLNNLKHKIGKFIDGNGTYTLGNNRRSLNEKISSYMDTCNQLSYNFGECSRNLRQQQEICWGLYKNKEQS